MRVIGYVRVSTEEQSREGVSLDAQAQKIRTYCELNDMELLDIIEDAGISAKDIKHRPGFNQVLNLVLTGEADGLVVVKLDRAFRSTTDALNTVQEFHKKGKALHSISERIDTESALGEFFFTLMASMAQMERRLIGERTKAALDFKKANGEKLGGDCPYGFMSKDGKLILDSKEQVVVERIHRMDADGHSMRAIAKALNHAGQPTRKGTAWTHVQVQRILKRK